MSELADVNSLYEPWAVRLRGARVVESYVGPVDREEADDAPKGGPSSRFEILLGIDSETDDVEARIAIVARYTHIGAHAEVQITSVAPLSVRGGVESDLSTADGRWEALLNYSGLAIEILWDFCRSSAISAGAGSTSSFEIPDDMPDPVLVKPLSLKE